MKTDITAPAQNEFVAAELTYISPALQEIVQGDEFAVLQRTLALYATVISERAM
jgi:hypothetical protein